MSSSAGLPSSDDRDSESVDSVSTDKHLASSERYGKLWRHEVENGVSHSSITEPGGGLGLKSSKLKSSIDAIVEESSIEVSPSDESDELKERVPSGGGASNKTLPEDVVELERRDEQLELELELESHTLRASGGSPKRESSSEDSSKTNSCSCANAKGFVEMEASLRAPTA